MKEEPQIPLLPEEAKVALYNELRGRIEFLDQLVAMGEEPDEIACDVQAVARRASILFFGWLVQLGIKEGTEILARMSEGLFEYVYLVNNARHSTLRKITKRILAEFIQLVDFNVDDRLWEDKINPFDGITLFYAFLKEANYSPRLSVERAVKTIRRSVKKVPCSHRQPGFDLMQ